MTSEDPVHELLGQLRTLRYRAWRVVPFADMEAKAYFRELEGVLQAVTADEAGEPSESEVRPLVRQYRRLCDRAEASWNLRSGNLWGPP